MGYEITQLQGEPIIIFTYSEPYDATADMGSSMRDSIPVIAHFVEAGFTQAYMLFDYSTLTITFSDLVQTLGEVRDDPPEAEAVPFEPEVILIGTDEMLPLAAEAITQEQYGANQLPKVFASLEAALEYVRRSQKPMSA